MLMTNFRYEINNKKNVACTSFNSVKMLTKHMLYVFFLDITVWRCHGKDGFTR